MDTSRIQPVGGNHAIEAMAIAIEWSAPLDEKRIADFEAVYESNEELKDFLPTLVPVHAFVFRGMHELAINAANGNLQRASDNKDTPQFIAQNGGFDIQRFDARGNISWVASIRPELISVNCSAYDRWVNIKPRAIAIIKPFLEIAMQKNNSIGAIGLQYQDAFRLNRGASPSESRELFRMDGKHIPKHLFDQPSFWHCHQGWFSTSPENRRILNNVATELADANGTHFARIGGQHRLFAQGADGNSSMPITVEQIEAALDCLHGENIAAINGILSNAALRAIGCKPEET